MADVPDLLSLVAPFVVDCPEGVQLWALREALCRFLMDSHVWREVLQVSADGTDCVSLDVPLAAINPHATILAVVSVMADGRTLDGAWIEDADVLSFPRPLPVAGTLCDVMAVLGVKPRSVVSVPDWIAQLYGSVIADFALYRIQSIPQRPYSDPAGAQQAMGRYQAGLHDAHVRRVTGGRSGPAAFVNPVPEYF